MRMISYREVNGRYKMRDHYRNESILPYFSEKERDMLSAIRLGKHESKLITIKVPFVGLWLVW